jgi:hypothetical protein
VIVGELLIPVAETCCLLSTLYVKLLMLYLTVMHIIFNLLNVRLVSQSDY